MKAQSTMDYALEKLRTRGLLLLNPLAPTAVARLHAFLLSRDVYADAHVPQTARNRGEGQVSRAAAAASECVCVHTRDAILAPHLLECALALTDLAALYLQCDPPVAYSANAFWTRPGPAALRGDIQAFHVDQDDVRFLAMFVYLTDVLAPEHGPHELIGSDGQARPVYGHAGSVFLSDTSRAHRGGKPTAGERGIAWVRWGVSERPAAGVWDKIEPIDAAELGARYPAAPRLRESIKLLVNQ